ncbi:MAG TPA: DUF3108 domain-containing protein [Anaeromyxobacteraceae bacterium]|nr:DUF3108 domain-containing protein [Anaeromyxobacteraceae bacterium]
MIAVAALAALLAAAEPCGLPPLRPGPVPWRAGEVLDYDLEVMGMVKAGVMSMEAGKPMFGGTQIPLKASVRNTSIFAKIRRIAGAAFSWVDAKTLLPERARDDVMEDGVQKTSDARLKPDAPTVVVATNFGGQKAETPYERKNAALLDALSAAYYLRAADLKPGQALCFDVVGLRRLWRFKGKVAAKPERVESPGGLFDTLRVEGTIERADKPEVRRPLYVWISTDPRRVLVGAVSEIDLGPASALLSKPPAR